MRHVEEAGPVPFAVPVLDAAVPQRNMVALEESQMVAYVVNHGEIDLDRTVTTEHKNDEKSEILSKAQYQQ
ncbi:unnamed protein product [Gongylonema pulchrum]|uniref:Uncharacterized protein n=1 Tax=Gongylonema pulchrum TaxID=637853 RepID=A0A183EPG7_9BILA|nr:unnamed protein product [Gongylonema pulchrum]